MGDGSKAPNQEQEKGFVKRTKTILDKTAVGVLSLRQPASSLWSSIRFHSAIFAHAEAKPWKVLFYLLGLLLYVFLLAPIVALFIITLGLLWFIKEELLPLIVGLLALCGLAFIFAFQATLIYLEFIGVPLLIFQPFFLVGMVIFAILFIKNVAFFIKNPTNPINVVEAMLSLALLVCVSLLFANLISLSVGLIALISTQILIELTRAVCKYLRDENPKKSTMFWYILSSSHGIKNLLFLLLIMTHAISFPSTLIAGIIFTLAWFAIVVVHIVSSFKTEGSEIKDKTIVSKDIGINQNENVQANQFSNTRNTYNLGLSDNDEIQEEEEITDADLIEDDAKFEKDIKKWLDVKEPKGPQQ